MHISLLTKKIIRPPVVGEGDDSSTLKSVNVDHWSLVANKTFFSPYLFQRLISNKTLSYLSNRYVAGWNVWYFFSLELPGFSVSLRAWTWFRVTPWVDICSQHIGAHKHKQSLQKGEAILSFSSALIKPQQEYRYKFGHYTPGRHNPTGKNVRRATWPESRERGLQ